MRALLLLPFLCCFTPSARAQWVLQSSPVKSDLLSVSTREGAAWASGTNGVILHSTDGTTWKSCAALPDGAQLELRSIQAIDGNVALVVSSGAGSKSAVYRTADACKSWQPVFANPEVSGSFDSLRLVTARQLYLLGEPVQGKFALYLSQDAGATWFIADDPGLEAQPGESAAGSTLLAQGAFLYFGTHGGSSPAVHYTFAKCDSAQPDAPCNVTWGQSRLPAGIAKGITAVGARTRTAQNGKSTTTLMAVGESTNAG